MNAHDTVELIWNYKVQVLPIIVSLIITELPNIIRKYKRLYYVPIYFSAFPLRELNPNLSTYLGEDYFIGTGSSLDEKEADELKRKIIIDSTVSMLISAILIPCYVGFTLSFFLNRNLLAQILFVILSYKSINIIRAIINFKEHAVSTKKNILFLSFIYTLYLGVFFQLTKNSYNWARPFIEKGNYTDLASSLSELIFSKVVAQGLILAALAAFFGNLITDKKIRDENIKNSRPDNQE